MHSAPNSIAIVDYHLNAALRLVPGKVTSNCNFVSFTAVLDSLDEEHAEILRRSCLWPLYLLRSVQFYGQWIDSLLCRLLKPVDGDALHFDLGGQGCYISIFEFALITGLRCTGEEAARAIIPTDKRLLNDYFNGHTTMTLAQLGDAFRGCDQISDKLKLGMVFILESVLRCHHRKTLIDVFHSQVVDNIDVFNSYPWGQRCFIDTLRICRRGHSMLRGDRPERKYNVYGMSLALQIWVYETVTILTGPYVKRGDTYIPRMHRW
ncbi:uncharacterized protein LOC111404453 [Olea europaea var. sylvestris]|uniref:uncharacterized protein LOC111404453 n=1 Tax=Olea europaea var. sylvestris TaxID=158386 RepID=UPI000C1D8C0F|nr:uncharacterized protein LOC111404453 [Olea europaea var. sylvestris]